MKTGNCDLSEFKEIENIAIAHEKQSHKYAWIVDRQMNERLELKTKKRSEAIIETVNSVVRLTDVPT